MKSPLRRGLLVDVVNEWTLKETNPYVSYRYRDNLYTIPVFLPVMMTGFFCHFLGKGFQKQWVLENEKRLIKPVNSFL